MSGLLATGVLAISRIYSADFSQIRDAAVGLASAGSALVVGQLVLSARARGQSTGWQLLRSSCGVLLLVSTSILAAGRGEMTVTTIAQACTVACVASLAHTAGCPPAFVQQLQAGRTVGDAVTLVPEDTDLDIHVVFYLLASLLQTLGIDALVSVQHLRVRNELLILVSLATIVLQVWFLLSRIAVEASAAVRRRERAAVGVLAAGAVLFILASLLTANQDSLRLAATVCTRGLIALDVAVLVNSGEPAEAAEQETVRSPLDHEVDQPTPTSHRHDAPNGDGLADVELRPAKQTTPTPPDTTQNNPDG